MSQLINRLLKPSVCKNVIRSHNKNVRMFSSSKSTYPYVLIDHLLKTTKHCSNDQVYYADKKLVIKDQGLAEEVREMMTVGFSHKDGWRVHLEKSEYSSKSLMVKNKKFLSVSPSGKYLWYLDLHFDEDNVQPNLSYLLFKEDPLQKLYKTDLEDYIWRSRTDHLVESPSGEHFLVKWFCEEDRDDEKIIQKTHGFMVFRADTICGELINTQDIGNLCIFLGHGEAFCVPASSSPGLIPNSIYYVGCNFGVHDIATNTTTNFYTKDKVPLRSTEFPYWPLPLSY
ncbi:hypothetical protein ARALYDRAFT_913973 [Arabidopsis lyrata subsp. lyrata]|uniref:KIB1-4 beta-propeller domain-containing protein n=1 Tax=Arabidopsis lyrata subsp. lyrata TaxID=81972 RepID=D7MFV2_ARALL|nr:hypothetical protein ARALYDRAFT_913973 [Arabidopsis lyrata subsp. lyrata]